MVPPEAPMSSVRTHSSLCASCPALTGYTVPVRCATGLLSRRYGANKPAGVQTADHDKPTQHRAKVQAHDGEFLTELEGSQPVGSRQLRVRHSARRCGWLRLVLPSMDSRAGLAGSASRPECVSTAMRQEDTMTAPVPSLILCALRRAESALRQYDRGHDRLPFRVAAAERTYRESVYGASRGARAAVRERTRTYLPQGRGRRRTEWRGAWGGVPGRARSGQPR
jgi:hypothetical protein